MTIPDINITSINNNTIQNVENEDVCCPLCKDEVIEGQDGVLCEMCSKWSHKTCLNMSDEEFNTLTSENLESH